MRRETRKSERGRDRQSILDERDTKRRVKRETNVETSFLGVTRSKEERFLSHVETPRINIPVARAPFIGVRD